MRGLRRIGWCAVVAATAAGVVAGPASAGPATGPQVVPVLSCAAGDDWLDYAYTVDASGGATVEGLLCRDDVTTGSYWAVEVHDTLADGKCAHAGVVWRPASGNPVGDYGMYVCGAGTSALFTSPVRNQTLYRSTELAAFVDAGPSASAPPFYF